MTPLVQAAVAGLAVTALLAVLTWVASLLRHDVSLVDRMWPVFIAAAGGAYAWTLHADSVRAAWMLALVALWTVRLSAYITHRNWGHGEDRRYRAIRARNEPGFALKSLVLVFALQAVLASVVALPLLLGLAAPSAIGWIDIVGVGVAAFGIVYEAVADAQMARFKADPANAGRVMDRGLWRHSRHPNYFGEFCTWWGLWLVCIGGAGPAGAWTVISPLLMSVLLLKVSGVSLLEKDIADRRPAYRDYIARTPAFFPWWLRNPRT